MCGNCNSSETVKYYPSCCILADRNNWLTLLDKLEKAVEVIKSTLSQDQVRGYPTGFEWVQLCKKAREFLDEEK